MSGTIRSIRAISENPLALLVIAQVVFVLVGIFFLEFNIEPADALLAVSSAALFELLLAYVKALRNKRPFRFFFPTSALAAGLGIAIFFRSVDPFYFVLASFIAIGSKYVIKRPGGNHIFNPSNIAVVSLAFLFPSTATIEFTQWGTSPFAFALISAISLLIAWRAKVLATTLSFLGSYTILLTALVHMMPDVFSPHHYGLLSPSLILFASFMITDPRTAPSGLYPRLAHGASVALMYFSLEAMGVRYALFAASFLVTIANLFSFPLVSLAARFAPPMKLLPNAGTLLLCSILFFSASGKVFMQNPAFGMFELSPRFLLFGIESPTLQRCAANPLFTQKENSGTELKAATWGMAWGDYDSDGHEDLFVSNADAPGILYHNNGDGSFSIGTDAAGLPSLRATSAFFVDYDNDERPDLFVAQYARGQESVRAIAVFRNIGGQFVDVTEEVGLAEFDAEGLRASMSFADYNNDGYLDLVYVPNGTGNRLATTKAAAHNKALRDPFFNRTTYLTCDAERVNDIKERFPLTIEGAGSETICAAFSDELTRRTGAETDEPDTAHIIDLRYIRPQSVRLFENRAGSFVEHPAFGTYVQKLVEENTMTRFSAWGARLTYTAISGRYWQPVSFDLDGDGLQDILLAVDFGTLLLLRNEGNFSFRDVSVESGVSDAGTAMGLDVSDYNGDGFLDFVVSNAQEDYLYTNRGNGTFERHARALAILGIGWGISFLDYDLDGKDDIFIVNGDHSNTDTTPWYNLVRRTWKINTLYRNEGNQFSDRTNVDMCAKAENSKALAIADFDKSGTPDIFVGTLRRTDIGTGNVLYRNTTRDRSYLRVELVGTQSNRQSVGAIIRVESELGTQTKTLLLGNSFYSQNSSVQTFGLGTTTALVQVLVRWPSGIESRVSSLPNKTLVITEPR